MTLLPLIQKTGNLQLQMNFNLSDPPTIRSFTSKDGNSYIEMPYTKLAFTEPEGQSERRAITCRYWFRSEQYDDK
ncbi:pilus biosynthesis protein (plasmid) [Escherichia coli]|nr:pilus biosynthesis protein [Escherichia coli]